MAEPRRQRTVRCQIHFLPDRHVSQKMSQVYRWLVPELEPTSAAPSAELTTINHEKDCRHLRSSFL
jgi:hypothetical protein